MDALLDEALETLTVMFMELVQTARALPRVNTTGEALIERARVVLAVVNVGAALRRMRARTAKGSTPAGGVRPLADQFYAAQAKVQAAQPRN